MEETWVKSSGEYIDNHIKLSAKARVWYNVELGYDLVVNDEDFIERFRALGGDKKRVLVEVDTPIARFIYATYGEIVRYGKRVYVKFHGIRDLNETWKALYWFGDFTVNVYIPVMKSVRGGR